jgi:hypothetical protein
MGWAPSACRSARATWAAGLVRFAVEATSCTASIPVCAATCRCLSASLRVGDGRAYHLHALGTYASSGLCVCGASQLWRRIRLSSRRGPRGSERIAHVRTILTTRGQCHPLGSS